MSKQTRVIGASILGTAIVAALSAFAAGHIGEGGTALTQAKVAAINTAATGTGADASPASSTHLTTLLPAAPAAQAGFDRFIIKYKDDAVAARSRTAMIGAMGNAVARAGIRAAAGGAVEVRHLRRMGVGADVVKLGRALDRVETETLLALLRSDPSVQYAQPDLRLQRLDFVPDDTRYELQWHYLDNAAGIRAPKAWDLSRGAGIKVAVLDTGYLDHQDLGANIVPGYDFISDVAIANDGDGRDADAHDPGDWEGSERSSFHGTHVAGTIAAVTNNAKGLAGVAFDAKVMPVRVLGTGGGDLSDIADAITWASGGAVDGMEVNADPAEVINMSLGGAGTCSSTPALQAAIDGAISRGVTVVVAAGNNGADAANFTPASCPGVITVGAHGSNGARSYFSNYGNTVTLSAPGGDASGSADANDRWIWSLGNSGTTTPVASPDGDRVVGMIGTSMASPHIAGVVALMQTAAVAAGQPALTPAQVRYILRKTARPFVVAPPASTPMGAGMVDATAAVLAARTPVPTNPSTLLTNRVALNGLAGAIGEGLMFEVTLPAGRPSLNLRTYGGSGDVTLYVSPEIKPSTVLYDRKSDKFGNGEAVVYSYPQAGTYYVYVVGAKAFAGVSVMATY
ncbi:S8 family serine peptidase [Lysobacter arenosi]|uniref:S8 family serine peptidase n=1 Tax=Lysobacter arenosi TaxID=2795387 RepID=A0ABX7R951_9GAMM|nr:S8 family peptidase [Lysobacter arenosi]QSX74505.1 S8 family serine peptidase [Lysobacter arenosi]